MKLSWFTVQHSHIDPAQKKECSLDFKVYVYQFRLLSFILWNLEYCLEAMTLVFVLLSWNRRINNCEFNVSADYIFYRRNITGFWCMHLFGGVKYYVVTACHLEQEDKEMLVPHSDGTQPMQDKKIGI